MLLLTLLLLVAGSSVADGKVTASMCANELFDFSLFGYTLLLPFLFDSVAAVVIIVLTAVVVGLLRSRLYLKVVVIVVNSVVGVVASNAVVGELIRRLRTLNTGRRVTLAAVTVDETVEVAVKTAVVCERSCQLNVERATVQVTVVQHICVCT